MGEGGGRDERKGLGGSQCLIFLPLIRVVSSSVLAGKADFTKGCAQQYADQSEKVLHDVNKGFSLCVY